MRTALKNLKQTKLPVLILSTPYSDLSTEEVIDWVIYFKFPFIRLNSEDIFEKFSTLFISSKKTEFNNCLINKEYHSIWYRRFNNNFDIQSILRYKLDNSEYSTVSNYLTECFKTIKYNLLHKLKFKNRFLTNSDQIFSNKISALEIAIKVGLNVPYYFITNNKHDLLQILNNDITCKYIIKDYAGHFAVFLNNKVYTVFTELLDKNTLTNFPNVFYPSFFQKLIDKSYEIRAFYLNKQIYSMAILSQKNEKTTIDFRHYQYKNPNRNVPYKLPLNVEKKIHRFMKESNLTTGSLDIIKGIDNKYYFLEVNPIGQFGMVSHPCNYNLEKLLASYLVSVNNSESSI